MARGRCLLSAKMGKHFLAEFLGTYIFVLFAMGAIAQIIFGHIKSEYTDVEEESVSLILVMCLSEGLGLALGMYTAGMVTGGHVNPAVSFAFAIMGRIGLVELIVYWLAQYLGAFLAAASIHAIYLDCFNEYDQLIKSYPNEVAPLVPATVFASSPQPVLSELSWFPLTFNVLVNSALFMAIFLTVTDKKGIAGSPGITPGLIGLSFTAIGLSLGLNWGVRINPARDFSGRLYSVAAKWPLEVSDPASVYWFLIPIIGPHIGTVIGAIIYYLFIGNHWPEECVPSEREDQQEETSFVDVPEDDERVLVLDNHVHRKFTDRTDSVTVRF